MKNNVSFCWKQRVVCGAMSERKKWREESAKGGKKKGGEMEESVTLVTAKNQHRCWKARTHARTWERKTRRSIILPTAPRKIKFQKNILSLFPWFFPLWGHIDPYTDREGNKKQREKKVYPTFGVMVLKKAKTAEHFAYWNYHQQMYSYEQQFSISSLGIVSTQLPAWGLPHHSKYRMNLI